MIELRRNSTTKQYVIIITDPTPEEKEFIFNDEYHISSGICYNFLEDKVYVSRNVFPDIKYGSRHPRDIMSVAAAFHIPLKTLQSWEQGIRKTTEYTLYMLEQLISKQTIKSIATQKKSR